MQSGTNSDDQFNKSGDIHDSLPKEEIREEKVHAPFNPLTEEAVNEKSYAKPNIKIDPNQINQPIPEPVFNPPPQQPDAPPPPPPAQEPFNPVMNELPKKEKNLAAQQAATMFIMGYEAVHKMGNNAIKIGDWRVKKLKNKNLIDVNIPLQLAEGRVPMGQFIQIYNEQSDAAFTVSQEFKDEVRPVLVRVLEKKGIGASDEHLLIGLVAQDLAFKVPEWIRLMKNKKDVLNQLVELTEQYRGANGQLPPQQGSPNPVPPQPQQHHHEQQPYTPPPPPPNYAPPQQHNNVPPTPPMNTQPAYAPPPPPPPPNVVINAAQDVPFEDQPIPEPESPQRQISYDEDELDNDEDVVVKKRDYGKKTAAPAKKKAEKKSASRPIGSKNRLLPSPRSRD